VVRGAEAGRSTRRGAVARREVFEEARDGLPVPGRVADFARDLRSRDVDAERRERPRWRIEKMGRGAGPESEGQAEHGESSRTHHPGG
jgi:hypothetical protein